MSEQHDEQALGKVYDAQLIARLWPFMSPHKRWIGLAHMVHNHDIWTSRRNIFSSGDTKPGSKE